ncbi:MAG: YceI family protein [Xanthomonadales bacterium]|nr:YceI family protein [Xanthomonadales bacterium]
MLRSLLFMLCLLPLPASARDWQVDPARSTLAFQGSYDGEAFEGRFKTFDARIAYDPADLTTAKFEVTVDLASADTGNAERDDTLEGGDFFAIAKFPKARFVTESFAKAADGSVEARGTLTLRDRTRPVVLKVTFAETGEAATLDVSTTLARKDFGLGVDKDWDGIGADVKVTGHLVLRAGG